jgi:DNA damage-binding protein 1
MGDSQLLKIHQTPVSALDSPTLPISPEMKATPPTDLISPSKGKGKADADIQEPKGFIVEGVGSHVSVLESFKNIAPIVDAVLVDTDGSGQVTLFFYTRLSPAEIVRCSVRLSHVLVGGILGL